MPDSTSTEFAKIVTEKIKKSDFSPFSGFFKKMGSPHKRPTIIKPYLLQEIAIEKNEEKNLIIKDEKEDLSKIFKEKVKEKVKEMKKGISDLENPKNVANEIFKSVSQNKKKKNSKTMDLPKFIENKEKKLNEDKMNLFITSLHFNQEENILSLSLINNEIRVYFFCFKIK